jgi:hypothetical protein
MREYDARVEIEGITYSAVASVLEHGGDDYGTLHDVTVVIPGLDDRAADQLMRFISREYGPTVDGIGSCDAEGCENTYDTASRIGRCGDCGLCAGHCPHVPNTLPVTWADLRAAIAAGEAAL